jgi:hypothetical protein
MLSTVKPELLLDPEPLLEPELPPPLPVSWLQLPSTSNAESVSAKGIIRADCLIVYLRLTPRGLFFEPRAPSNVDSQTHIQQCLVSIGCQL